MKTLKELIQQEQGKCREEYKKAYKGLVSDELLGEGNPWIESLIASSMTITAKAVGELVGKKDSLKSYGQWQEGWQAGYNENVDAISGALKTFLGEEDGFIATQVGDEEPKVTRYKKPL